jgi:thymidylate synthase (FAD)
MKIIDQDYEILSQLSPDFCREIIERCGRVAYKSESKITEESSKLFVSGLVGRNHLSVIEHASVTVKFITDRGVSHELVRHRLASFTQESTMTANLREWRHVFQLRAIDRGAHPQMRDLMIPLYEYFRSLLPEIFDLGSPE